MTRIIATYYVWAVLQDAFFVGPTVLDMHCSDLIVQVTIDLLSPYACMQETRRQL